MTLYTQAARSIFLEALRQVDVSAAVVREIHCDSSTLTLLDQTHDLASIRTVLIIAIGKAASTMAHSAIQALQHCSPDTFIEAIVVAPAPPRDSPHLTFYLGGHPTPDASSRAAALDVLNRLHAVDPATLILFLISGGASSMLELPLDPRISLADTAAFHRVLVASGLPIHQMNVLRKHFSAVKAGRLATAASRPGQPAPSQYTLIVSDVPAAAPDTVGSGPSLPDPGTGEQCRSIFHKLAQRTTLPPSIVAWFTSPELPETPKPSDPAFARSHSRVILSSDHLIDAAAPAAARLGYHVEIDNSCDDWPFAQAALHLLNRIAELSSHHPHVCLLSAGELSVPLTQPAGQGGRNQHFALFCALALERTRAPITVLSAGSDGIDGQSAAAGAIADSTTCTRARALGFDPAQALTSFDSYPLFHALGDAILTGPTGNNLRDLRILLSGNPP